MINYSSRTLNDAQLNYTTTEKELLVVGFAVEKFRPYLLGSKIIIFTDHSTLRYLMMKRMSRPDSFVGSFFFKNSISRFEIRKA